LTVLGFPMVYIKTGWRVMSLIIFTADINNHGNNNKEDVSDRYIVDPPAAGSFVFCCPL